MMNSGGLRENFSAQCDNHGHNAFRFQSIIESLDYYSLNTPDNPAIMCDDTVISYRELNAKTDQLAGYFLQLGVREEDIVSILLPRGPGFIECVLAIWKCRAAYLPLQPDHPPARQLSIIHEAASQFLISEGAYIKDELDSRFSGEKIVFSHIPENPETPDKKNPCLTINERDLAYVIFTSGSTGKPKGVMIEHLGMMNHLEAFGRAMKIDDRTRIAQTASQCFDISVWQMVTAFRYGGTTVVYGDDIIKDPDAFARAVKKDKINILQLVPTYLQLIFNVINPSGLVFPDIKCLVVTGEACPVHLARHWYQFNKYSSFINTYGPTEASDDVTLYHVPENFTGNNLPIGEPIQNMEIFVLNEELEKCAPGQTGEIYISGIGLARGYINRPDLTEKAFIPHPFYPDQLMYKSGDIGRWVSPGYLEFSGRIDSQIKLHGHRIELSEIENSLLGVPQVKQAAVILQGAEDKPKNICAFLTLGTPISIDSLRQRLENTLPEYMIPRFFNVLEKMPLTPNGKIDRAALPLPENQDSLVVAEDSGYSEIEKKIIKIWSGILKVDSININDDFYALGGDSIQAIMIVAKLKQEGYHVTTDMLLKSLTVKRIASRVKKIRNRMIPADMAEEENHIPFGLTPIQHWFIEEEFENENFYTQDQLIVADEIDIERLQDAVNRLIRHHEVFRLKIEKQGSEYIQYYREDPGDWFVKRGTLPAGDDQENSMHSLCRQWQHELSLSGGKMFVLGVISGHHDKRDRLYIALHHTIVDGISWRIILEDLQSLYKGERVLLKSDSYRKWHQQLTGYSGMERTSRQKEYWLAVTHTLKSFTVPYDFKEVPGKGFPKELFKSVLQKRESEILIKHCPGFFGVPVNVILLSAFALALRDWTRLSRISFSLEGHGRESVVPDIDISRTSGWFTSLFPVAFKLPESEDRFDIIMSVNEQYNQIPDRGLSYGALRYCHPDKEIRQLFSSRYPEISFNYLGQFQQRVEKNEWIFFNDASGQDSVSGDNHFECLLSLNSSFIEGHYHMFTYYSGSHLKEETIRNFMERYRFHLTTIIDTYRRYLKASSGPGPINNQRPLPYPLSPLQEGFLFHYLQDPQSDQYKVQTIVEYRQEIEPPLFKAAFGKLVEEHEILRSFFRWEESKRPQQFFAGRIALAWKEYDFADLSSDACMRKKAELIKEDRKLGYDLSQPGHLRCALIKEKEHHFTFLLSYHHIINDGWGLNVLISRLSYHYQNLLLKKESPAYGYGQFSRYLHWYQNQERWDILNFWKQEMAPLEEVTDICIKKEGVLPDPNKPIECQGEYDFSFTQGETAFINSFIAEYAITSNTFLQVLWGKLLSLYSQNDVVCFGSTVSGRFIDLEGIEFMSGMYINTLPIVLSWKPDMSITGFFKRFQEKSLKINKYNMIRLREITRLSGLKAAHLFHSIIFFENYPAVEDYEGLRVHKYTTIEKTNYPLTILCNQKEGLYHLKMIYDTACFTEEAMVMIKDHLKRLVSCIRDNSGGKIHELSLLTNSDVRRVSEDWNKVHENFYPARTIPQCFYEQVLKNRDRIALRYVQGELTYHELNQRADNLAYEIMKETGAGGEMMPPGTAIGLYMRRSPEMIIAILAVLKTGAAYVPLDINTPSARNQHILEDARARILISDTECDIPFKGIRILLKNRVLTESPLIQPQNPPDPESVACILYTSGSTGQAKGIMVTHRNIIHFVLNQNAVRIHEGDSVLQFSNYTFDAFSFDLYCTLLNGGILVGTTPEQILDPRELKSLTGKYPIKFAVMTTSLFNYYVDHDISSISSIGTILVGGEKASVPVMNKALQTLGKDRIINVYGPAETTVFASFHKISGFTPEGRSVPIGRPIRNSQVFILDSHLKMLPPGITGEICISSESVTSGYLNSSAMTGSRYVRNPYRPDVMLYKTGDYGRWLETGEIEFIGRKDDQIKILGHRIELGEIEKKLYEIPGVKQEVVLFGKDSGASLSAYVESSKKISEAFIRQALSLVLPQYMVPKNIFVLKQFPINKNGKIDKQELMKISTGRPCAENGHRIPVTETDKMTEQLMEIWKEVLELRTLGAEDDFYSLGGHSLNALQLANRIRQMGYHITVNQIIELQSISGISRYLLSRIKREPEKEPEAVALNQAAPGSAFPLSPVQARQFERKLPGLDYYIASYLAVINRKIDPALIRQAIEALIQEHGSLSLVFVKKQPENQWAQRYSRFPLSDHFRIMDLKDFLACEHEKMILKESSETLKTFDIVRGPLFKVLLFTNSTKGDVILLAFHHLVFDGFSVKLILDELSSRLSPDRNHEGTRESDKPGFDNYRKWCLAIEHYSRSSHLKRERGKWEKRLTRGENLLSEYPSEKVPTHLDMRTYDNELFSDSFEVAQFQGYLSGLRLSPAAYALAALAQAAPVTSGSPGLLVNIMSHQRESVFPDLSLDRTTGFFAGAYPVLIPRAGTQERTTEGLSKEIAEILIDTPANGFDYLVLAHSLKEPALRIKVHTLFHLLPDDPLEEKNRIFTPLNREIEVPEFKKNESAYRLNITMFMNKDAIVLRCYYSTLHYSADFIKQFSRRFKENIRKSLKGNENENY